MPRGKQSDPRDIFHIDRLRVRNRSFDPPASPEKNFCEIYIKNGVLFKIDDQGVATPINGLGVSASPGFTWGRRGTISPPNAYLFNDRVLSHITGRLIKFTDAVLRKVLVTNSALSTCVFTIQEHDGTTFTDLGTISLVAQRSNTVDFAVPITIGKELAIKVTSGSCKNPVVGVILDGLF